MPEEVLEEYSPERHLWEYSTDGLLGVPADRSEVDELFDRYRQNGTPVNQREVAGLEFYDAALGGDSVRAIVGENSTVYLNSDGESVEELVGPFSEVLEVEGQEVYDLL